MKKTILSFVAAATIGLGLAGTAQADLLSDIKAKGEIVAATEMHYAPFDLLKDGEYVGIDRDLFDKIAKDLGVKAKYIDLPWNSILPGLEAGKFDFVIAPVTITAERMKRYSFTPANRQTPPLLWPRKPETAPLPSLKILQARWLAPRRAPPSSSSSRPSPTSSPRQPISANTPILTKPLPTWLLAASPLSPTRCPLMGYAAVQRPGLFELVMPPFGDPKFFGWVATGDENSKTLIEAINASLLKMHEDGRLKAINEKWLGSNPDLPTTMPEVK